MRAPTDLVATIGRQELVKALGTNDPEEARRRIRPVTEEWHRQFDAARNRKTMTEQHQDDVVWSHFTGILERDDRIRAEIPNEAAIDAATKRAVARVERDGIDIKDPLQALDAALDIMVQRDRRAGSNSVDAAARRSKLAHLRKDLATGESALVAHETDAYLEKNGLTLGGTDDRSELTRKLIRVEFEALKHTLERDTGDYGGSPSDQLINKIRAKRDEVAAKGESIEEAFEQFARENANNVTPDRINQSRRNIGVFIQSAGKALPVSKIDKKAVREWKALLIKYPVRAADQNEFRGMSIKEVVRHNEVVGKTPISDRTVNRYLSSLGAFCKWAMNNGYLDTNPVADMSLSKERSSPTHPFSVDQMNELFRSPIFTGCQSDTVWSRIARKGNVLISYHRFWVPLIMLYSGARPGEIAQLAVSDVRKELGHWIMHITTEGEGRKSVKTKGSMRVAPIHTELIALGFLQYHGAQLKAQGLELFPGAKRNERGQIMSDYSREFGKYLTRLGMKDGRGLSLYSFRHGATDALRRAGYLDEQFGFILGHTQGTTTGRYGIMPQGILEQRVQLIEAIDYAGLDLSHLKPN